MQLIFYKEKEGRRKKKSEEGKWKEEGGREDSHSLTYLSFIALTVAIINLFLINSISLA